MKKSRIINIVIAFVALVSILGVVYFYYELKVLKATPQTVALKETADLILKVSKLYLLPVGEEPTIATVSDPTILKSQAFLIDAQKGDKVLIYIKAGKAILYRPSIGKIIDTTSVNNLETQ